MSAPDSIWISPAFSFITSNDCEWMVWEDKPTLNITSYEYHRAPDWVSVEERLPEEQAYYNVIIENTPGFPYYDILLWTGKNFLKDTVYRHKIVKWLDMPLPSPPKEIA